MMSKRRDEAVTERLKQDRRERTIPVFEDFRHVFCETCKARVSGPFQATGLGAGKGAWRGQCTDSLKVCSAIVTFDLMGGY